MKVIVFHHMRPHHEAWLKHHKMDEAWLEAAIMAGMDVHHLDENRDNNDPSNLILIFSMDHMKLHGMPICHMSAFQRASEWVDIEKWIAHKSTVGKIAYDIRDKDRVSWDKVAKKMTGPDSYKPYTSTSALHAAKYYAQKNNLQWPVLLPGQRETVNIEGKKWPAVRSEAEDQDLQHWLNRTGPYAPSDVPY